MGHFLAGSMGPKKQGGAKSPKRLEPSAEMMIEGEYKGPLVDGVREGQGSVRWANGDSYTGDFKQGMRHGKGVYVTQKGLHK
jgi:hypothetical protein